MKLMFYIALASLAAADSSIDFLSVFDLSTEEVATAQNDAGITVGTGNPKNGDGLEILGEECQVLPISVQWYQFTPSFVSNALDEVADAKTCSCLCALYKDPTTVDPCVAWTYDAGGSYAPRRSPSRGICFFFTNPIGFGQPLVLGPKGIHAALTSGTKCTKDCGPLNCPVPKEYKKSYYDKSYYDKSYSSGVYPAVINTFVSGYGPQSKSKDNEQYSASSNWSPETNGGSYGGEQNTKQYEKYGSNNGPYGGEHNQYEKYGNNHGSYDGEQNTEQYEEYGSKQYANQYEKYGSDGGSYGGKQYTNQYEKYGTKKMAKSRYNDDSKYSRSGGQYKGTYSSGDHDGYKPLYDSYAQYGGPGYGAPPQMQYGGPPHQDYGGPSGPGYDAPPQMNYGGPPQQDYGGPSEYGGPHAPDYGGPGYGAQPKYGGPKPYGAPVKKY